MYTILIISFFANSKAIVGVIHGHDSISAASQTIKNLANEVFHVQETHDGGKVDLAPLVEAATLARFLKQSDLCNSVEVLQVCLCMLIL